MDALERAGRSAEALNAPEALRPARPPAACKCRPEGRHYESQGKDGEIATPAPRAGCMVFSERPILAEIPLRFVRIGRVCVSRR